jgi:multimeric flavodoxin WrbA
MRALVLNGERKDEKFCDSVYNVLLEELENRGFQVNKYILRDIEIASCIGCFGCWMKTPGICVINDEQREIARKAVQSDLLVFLTPVTFGGYSSELKKALDRLIPIILPYFEEIGGEIHHAARYEKYPSIIAIGILTDHGEESEKIFKKLVNRNVINFHAPNHVAEIIPHGQDAETIRDKIGKILKEVGVKE